MSVKAKLLWLSFLCALALTSICSADVMVSLKNGRTITADSCKEAGDKLVCEKLGGIFEFSKKEVSSMKEIDASQREAEIFRPWAVVAADGVQQAADAAETAGERAQSAAETASAGGRQSVDRTGKETILKGVDPAADVRLEAIHTRKMELGAEQEKLAREQEQLRSDMRSTGGTVWSSDTFNDLTSRDQGLKTRIDKFNEEVIRLDREEKDIAEKQRGR